MGISVKSHWVLTPLLLMSFSACKPKQNFASLADIDFPENEILKANCPKGELSRQNVVSFGAFVVVSSDRDLCRQVGLRPEAMNLADDPSASRTDKKQNVAIVVTNSNAYYKDHEKVFYQNATQQYRSNGWNVVEIDLKQYEDAGGSMMGRYQWLQDQVRAKTEGMSIGKADTVYYNHGYDPQQVSESWKGDEEKWPSRDNSAPVYDHITSGRDPTATTLLLEAASKGLGDHKPESTVGVIASCFSGQCPKYISESARPDAEYVRNAYDAVLATSPADVYSNSSNASTMLKEWVGVRTNGYDMKYDADKNGVVSVGEFAKTVPDYVLGQQPAYDRWARQLGAFSLMRATGAIDQGMYEAHSNPQMRTYNGDFSIGRGKYVPREPHRVEPDATFKR